MHKMHMQHHQANAPTASSSTVHPLQDAEHDLGFNRFPSSEDYSLFPDESSINILDFINNDDLNQHLSIEYPPDSKDFQHVPFPRKGPPARESFSGMYNFDVSLSSDSTDKKKYVYSQPLNKVFLCMLTELPVHFRWDYDRLSDKNLWLRATLILADSDQQEARVVRCHNHRVTSDVSNKDVPENILAHVLRSARQTEDVVYCGKDEDEQQWLSVAMSLDKRPATGCNYFNHVYKFCCKHSCTSGINRRRIEILFTLEDSYGEIYGRQSLGVRVCSCPRRDMEKEESEMRDNSGHPPTKKRKANNSPKANHSASLEMETLPDDNLYNVNFQIRGLENYKQLLNVAHGLMAGKFVKMSPTNPSFPLYEECLIDLQSLQTQTPQPCDPK